MNGTHIYNLGIRVLIYREDGAFCAHALELDLLGYGKTEKKALSELLEAITCHLSFAKSRNDDTLLPFPAPREFYDKWETAHADALKNEISQAKFKAMAIKAIWIAVDRHLTAAPKARFAAVELSCA